MLLFNKYTSLTESSESSDVFFIVCTSRLTWFHIHRTTVDSEPTTNINIPKDAYMNRCNYINTHAYVNLSWILLYTVSVYVTHDEPIHMHTDKHSAIMSLEMCVCVCVCSRLFFFCIVCFAHRNAYKQMALRAHTHQYMYTHSKYNSAHRHQHRDKTVLNNRLILNLENGDVQRRKDRTSFFSLFFLFVETNY